MPITIIIDPDIKILSDILTTAVEGGTGYWAQCSDYEWSDENPETTQVRLHEIEADHAEYTVGHLVTIDSIAEGLSRMAADKRYPQFAKMVTQALVEKDYDAEVADIAVQYAIFGEMVYA